MVKRGIRDREADRQFRLAKNLVPFLEPASVLSGGVVSPFETFPFLVYLKHDCSVVLQGLARCGNRRCGKMSSFEIWQENKT